MNEGAIQLVNNVCSIITKVAMEVVVGECRCLRNRGALMKANVAVCLRETRKNREKFEHFITVYNGKLKGVTV